MTLLGIGIVKGIPSTMEQDSYFDINIRNSIVIDDRMIEAGSDNRVVNLLTNLANPGVCVQGDASRLLEALCDLTMLHC